MMDIAFDYYTPAPYVWDIGQYSSEPPKKVIGTLTASQSSELPQTSTQIQSGHSGFEFGYSRSNIRIVSTGEAKPRPTEGALSSTAPTDIDRIAKSRIQILAMKYAGVESAEIDARLEVLNSKLNKILPRVDPQHVQVLLGVAELIKNDKDDLEKQMLELGIAI